MWVENWEKCWHTDRWTDSEGKSHGPLVPLGGQRLVGGSGLVGDLIITPTQPA